MDYVFCHREPVGGGGGAEIRHAEVFGIGLP